MRILIGCILAALLVTPALRAQEAPAAQPLLTEKTVLRLSPNQVMNQIMPAVVTVRIEIKPDPDSVFEASSPAQIIFDEFVRQHLKVDVSGLRIAADGTVLIRDPNVPMKRYGSIDAVDKAGNVTPMKIAAVLENHAAVLLSPAEKAAEAMPFISFAPVNVRAGDDILLVQPAFLEGTLCLDIQKANAAASVVSINDDMAEALWWENSSGSDLSHILPTTAPLVIDERGQAIGIGLDSALWRSTAKLDSWIGTSIMQDRRIGLDEINKIQQQIQERASASVEEVEIFFRADSAIAQQLSAANPTVTVYGILLDDTCRILVPTDLDREAVQQIDKIIVHEGDTTRAAKFLGLFRTFGGLLIQADGLKGKPAPQDADTIVPRGRIFYTLHSVKRFGRRVDEADYNRYLDVEFGYKENHYIRPAKEMRVGDLVLDEQARVVGFYAPLVPDPRDEVVARQGAAPRPSLKRPRLYFMKEVADVLKPPSADFDLAARPLTRKEEQGLVWLGVEFQPLTPPLARALKVEGPARGGARGLLVTHVYTNGPAAKLGIAPKDILLSLVPEGNGEIDLMYFARPAEAIQAEQQPLPLPRLWKPRRNYLTTLLTLLGPGRMVNVHYLHGQEEKNAPVTLETAPIDYESAEESKVEALGLSVRELTYEVRDVLKLGPQAPGVVVSDVTAGGKAAIAQIHPYEILLAIDGQPVSSLKEFDRLVQEASGRGQGEFQVSILGQSRIVELGFGGKMTP